MWRYGEVDGYKWEAKVYHNRSVWGINEGRVSKLYVHDPSGTQVYEYERSLTFDHLPAGLLDRILEAATV